MYAAIEPWMDKLHFISSCKNGGFWRIFDKLLGLLFLLPAGEAGPQYLIKFHRLKLIWVASNQHFTCLRYEYLDWNKQTVQNPIQILDCTAMYCMCFKCQMQPLCIYNSICDIKSLNIYPTLYRTDFFFVFEILLTRLKEPFWV